MGLDITYYSGLQPMEDYIRNDDWEPVHKVTGEPYEGGDEVKDPYTYLSANPDFPGHISGLLPGFYTFDKSDGFRAGSYSGYSAFRDMLAEFAGYEADEGPSGNAYSDRYKYAAAAWEKGEGDFSELLNFSDCEGTIGPVYAKKLLGDFERNEPRLETFQGKGERWATPEDIKWFSEKYRDWMTACRFAADNGAIDFH